MQIILCLVALAAISSAFVTHSRVNEKLNPFCHGLDCPIYNTTQTFKGYELRHYPISKWVATSVYVMEFTNDTNSEMFHKLFNYIAGNNTLHKKIDMTTPVILKVDHGPGPTCESTFTMYFMVPFALQQSTPMPTEHDVFLTDMDPMDVYVKSFETVGKTPSFQDKMDKLIQLAGEINDQSKYNDSSFMFATYDGPYTLHKHTEVWLPTVKKM